MSISFIKMFKKMFSEKKYESQDLIFGSSYVYNGGISDKYWINILGKQYIFKYNENDDSFENFSEALVSIIAKKCGIDCVNALCVTDPLYETQKRGTLVESYILSDVQEVVLYRGTIQINLKEVLSFAKNIAKEKNLILDEQIEFKLLAMALLDFVCCQNDRHSKNIEFLVKKLMEKEF